MGTSEDILSESQPHVEETYVNGNFEELEKEKSLVLA